MRFMNEWDIDLLLRRTSVDTPNRAAGAIVLSALARWTNENSDGWVYWPKPARAAGSLMKVLEEGQSAYYRGAEVVDLTDAELKRALAPIKAFLTRQGVPHSVVGL